MKSQLIKLSNWYPHVNICLFFHWLLKGIYLYPSFLSLGAGLGPGIVSPVRLPINHCIALRKNFSFIILIPSEHLFRNRSCIGLCLRRLGEGRSSLDIYWALRFTFNNYFSMRWFAKNIIKYSIFLRKCLTHHWNEAILFFKNVSLDRNYFNDQKAVCIHTL